MSRASADVGVVIVTFNSAEDLAGCLRSLPPCSSVLIVDNGSVDETLSVAEAAGVSCVPTGQNLGFGAAANLGAARLTEPFLLLVNPDAILGPGAVAALRSAFDAEPRLAIAGARLSYPGGGEQRSWWPFPSARRSWRHAIGISHWRPVERHPDGTVESIVGAAFMVRRVAWDQLGGFDRRYWLYGEETDLCRRAWDSGWTVRLVDEAKAVHRVGGSAGGASDLVFEHFMRSAELFVRIHEGRRALVSHRVATVVGAALRVVLWAPWPGRAGQRRREWRALRRGLRALRNPATV
ncbi:MAG TPA: glycosyltransferase family 2 protein [Acidimicrobiales bacterium]|nr:glycosyltransferase family 2 protein [Acidimicrobiales bacterium]